MKIFSAAALSLATLAPFAAAAGYTATWTQEGECDGAILLGEYTASESCTEVDCAVIPGVTGQGARTTCVDDHITGANAVLKDVPYVLVEVYPEGSNCEGNFTVAVAVTANGECIPGTNGKASYNVTMADDNTAVWLQYTTPDCSGEEVRVPFTEEQLNGETCTGGFLKALGSKPAASGGSEGNSTDAPSTSGYTVKWTVEGDSCDGSIWLGEYTKTDTCTAVECAPIEGVTTAGAKTTCVEDHIEGAAAVLKDVPYVLVEVYPEGSNCTGDFGIAIAVTANGACIPGTDGKASYNVTMGAENSALWLQYTTPDCSGEEVRVPFPEAELKGEACTAGFLKAWAIKPASAGGNDTSSTETPVPSATESGAVATSVVGAAALSVAAVFSASLL